jgi:F-type H+-transporting ATPase subunit delta
VSKAPGALVSRYARSLFGAAQERQSLDAVRRDLQALHQLWDEHPELKALLLNPGLSRKKVRAILTSVAEKLQLNAVSRAFIDVLLDKDRLDILPAIQPRFERLMLDHEGKIEVKVTTAVPVSDQLQMQIELHLKSKSGKDPVVEWRQNPALIGGVVIEWPDHVFDGSLARKIENMKAQLAGNV